MESTSKRCSTCSRSLKDLLWSLIAYDKTNPSRAVDVRIEFDCKENVLANITSYCFIVHNYVIEYCLLFNVVLKLI